MCFFDSCQSLAQVLTFVGETLVIEAQQVQQGAWKSRICRGVFAILFEIWPVGPGLAQNEFDRTNCSRPNASIAGRSASKSAVLVVNLSWRCFIKPVMETENFYAKIEDLRDVTVPEVNTNFDKLHAELMGLTLRCSAANDFTLTGGLLPKPIKTSQASCCWAKNGRRFGGSRWVADNEVGSPISMLFSQRVSVPNTGSCFLSRGLILLYWDNRHSNALAASHPKKI